jgi:hypothetical protein
LFKGCCCRRPPEGRWTSAGNHRPLLAVQISARDPCFLSATFGRIHVYKKLNIEFMMIWNFLQFSGKFVQIRRPPAIIWKSEFSQFRYNPLKISAKKSGIAAVSAKSEKISLKSPKHYETLQNLIKSANLESGAMQSVQTLQIFQIFENMCTNRITGKFRLRCSRGRAPTSLLYDYGSQALIWIVFCPC